MSINFPNMWVTLLPFQRYQLHFTLALRMLGILIDLVSILIRLIFRKPFLLLPGFAFYLFLLVLQLTLTQV